MVEKGTHQFSSIGFKYPTLRDHYLKTGLKWLEGKRADDGAEGLWRVHDKLYDLQKFVEIHPGGEEYLSLTKGTDITELFESHHLSDLPKSILNRYFVREAAEPRNSPFTFNEDGFYRTLRRRVAKKMVDVPRDAEERSKRLADLLLYGYISFAILAVIFKSLICVVFAGILLGLTAVVAHNFLHQKDSFRMYYFNFTLMDYQHWRISHSFSHHPYPNTIIDLEISSLEPFLWYLPAPKLGYLKYLQIIISPPFYMSMFVGFWLKSSIPSVLTGERKFTPIFMLPFSILALMIMGSGEIILPVVYFLLMQIVAGFYFGAVGLNAGHHHPNNFHDGDTPRSKEEMDWGLYQLDAVTDRKETTGSHFLVLTNFGDHALHHLFPTIDHGLLEHIYPVFLKTCAEFGIKWKVSSQMALIKGQLRQLLKVTPNKEPPKACIAMKCL